MIGRFFDKLEDYWFWILLAIIAGAYYKGFVAEGGTLGNIAIGLTNTLEARNASNTGFLSYPSGGSNQFPRYGTGHHLTAPYFMTAASTMYQDG